MQSAMEVALSEVGENVRRRVRSTATVAVATTTTSVGDGKQANRIIGDPGRGNANQWADKEKSRVQFEYDADAEAERWWAEHGQKMTGSWVRM